MSSMGVEPKAVARDRAHTVIADGFAALREHAAVAVSLRVPTAPLDVFLSALDEPTKVAWLPPDGPAAAGVGEAWRFDLSGTDGLPRLRSEIDGLFGRMARRPTEAPAPPAPRLFGGLAFAPGASRGAPWDAFGDGSFVLPRWTYFREGDLAWVTVVLTARDDAGEIQRRFSALREALGSGEEGPLLRTAAGDRHTAEVDQLDPERWAARIEAIRRVIANGAFEKLVAARRAEARFAGPIDPLEVLRNLDRDYPDCTRFLVSRSGTAFIGATPERLFSKRGARLLTVALAGSIGAGSDADSNALQGEKLLASAKDRREHALVVREITRSLAPLTDALSHPPEPRIRRVRSLLHLETPFEGTMAPRATALEVLEAMHPTPAVGGIPRPEAMAWIMREEESPRGWYTGPVGWIDADGDAELVVAIRCGVVSGASAHVFSGAGIMADSDPASEYEETRLKQQPLLRALGLSS